MVNLLSLLSRGSREGRAIGGSLSNLASREVGDSKGVSKVIGVNPKEGRVRAVKVAGVSLRVDSNKADGASKEDSSNHNKEVGVSHHRITKASHHRTKGKEAGDNPKEANKADKEDQVGSCYDEIGPYQ